jgi:hypothetical protein
MDVAAYNLVTAIDAAHVAEACGKREVERLVDLLEMLLGVSLAS